MDVNNNCKSTEISMVIGGKTVIYKKLNNKGKWVDCGGVGNGTDARGEVKGHSKSQQQRVVRLRAEDGRARDEQQFTLNKLYKLSMVLDGLVSTILILMFIAYMNLQDGYKPHDFCGFMWIPIVSFQFTLFFTWCVAKRIITNEGLVGITMNLQLISVLLGTVFITIGGYILVIVDRHRFRDGEVVVPFLLSFVLVIGIAATLVMVAAFVELYTLLTGPGRTYITDAKLKHQPLDCDLVDVMVQTEEDRTGSSSSKNSPV